MYKVKDEAWEDFKSNYIKYGFHKVGPIYEYVEDYLHDKLYVHEDRILNATHYLDNVDGRTKIIKKLLAENIIERI